MDRNCKRGDGLSYGDDSISHEKRLEACPPACGSSRLPGHRGGDAVYQCCVMSLFNPRVEGKSFDHNTGYGGGVAKK